MNILIENEAYSLELLEKLFDDSKFYNEDGTNGTITSVGYYYSFEKRNLVFMLPKVFMKDKNLTVFKCSKYDLIDYTKKKSIKHQEEYQWIRQLSVFFYNSLFEYKNRVKNTSILNKTQTFELNTNLGDKEYSFIDILLSFVNFHKKNKQQLFYINIENISNKIKKPKWEKTIRKTSPFLINNNTPIYIKVRNKKKRYNKKEELLIYYFSILNHLNNEHRLKLKIDKTLNLITNNNFEKLCSTGISKLRKIKYRYFSDTLKKMYNLCELYFSQYDNSNIKKRREDFLSINNYNLVFEDMVDKLFSDDFGSNGYNEVNINNLKNNDDGKIIDHLYGYESLIDTSNIFYIGDSKYYKSGSTADKVSKYKQFTYAKNIIQFNVNLIDTPNQLKNFRYRDKLTEGYNISPNFFIYGYIHDPSNYNEPQIIKKGNPVKSYHFEKRLFDRDTLFVHQYEINFLFILKAYTHFNNFEVNRFRNTVKKKFRNHFLEFFNNSDACDYKFYKSNLNPNDYKEFINKNFKKLNGKCFCTIDNKLLLAKHKYDTSLDFCKPYFNRIHL